MSDVLKVQPVARTWSTAGEMSAPVNRPDVPMIGSVINAALPVPVETSSTRHPRLYLSSLKHR